jgi:MFS family permease
MSSPSLTRIGAVESTPAQASRPDGEARRSLAAGMALVAAGVLPGFLVASLAPRIRDDFAFADSTLGVAVAVFYVVSALTSSPAGRHVERVGPARGMRLAAALTVVSCLAAATLAESAVSLTGLLLLGALANAIAGPAVSALLKQRLSPERHGLGFGAQQAAAPLGALLAGLALPLVAIPLGWRWAFVATALLAFLAVVLGPAAAAAPLPSERGVRGRRLGSVYALALAAALASAAGVGLVSFLVLYSVENGMSETGAGLLLGAVSLTAAFSRVVLGAVADRRGHDPLRPVAAMLLVSVAAYGLLIVGAPAAIALGAVLAGGLGWAWPGALNLAVVQRSPDAPAWAVGIMMAGLFAGAVAGPLVVGLLAERELFSAAWLTCAGFSLLAALTVAAVIAAGNREAASGTRRPIRSR